jgi:outer membrane protein assembly factor BamD
MHYLIGNLLISLLFLPFTGCTGKGELTHEESCHKRFEKLHTKYLDGKYSFIRESLSDLLATCSGSGFIEQALYELAESHFHLREWIEAKAEYANLLRDFPHSDYAEKSHYRKAECSMKMILSPDRDQAQTDEAIEDFELFLTNFPNSTLADSAKQKIFSLFTRKARKDIQIASLYMKMDEYQAAAIYLKGVLEKFPNYTNQSQVRLSLAKCYLSLNQFDEAEIHLKELQSPNSDKMDKSKVDKLKKLLQQKRNKMKEHTKLKKSGESNPHSL